MATEICRHLIRCKSKQKKLKTTRNLRFFLIQMSYKSLFARRIHQLSPLTRTEMINAMGNPHVFCSIPLMRFMPKREAMSVGNIMMIDTDVNVRITVFMLLLMMLE